MKKREIIIDDVLKEIARLNEYNPEGWTISEMSDKTGNSPALCRRIVAQLIKAGKMRCNGRKSVISIDGTYRFAPVYVYIDKGKVGT